MVEEQYQKLCTPGLHGQQTWKTTIRMTLQCWAQPLGRKLHEGRGLYVLLRHVSHMSLKLVRTSLYKYFCRCVFSFLIDKYLGLELVIKLMYVNFHEKQILSNLTTSAFQLEYLVHLYSMQLLQCLNLILLSRCLILFHPNCILILSSFFPPALDMC